MLEALVEVITAGDLEVSQTLRSPNGHMKSDDNKGRGKAITEMFRGLQTIKRIQGGPAWVKTRTI